MLISMTPKELIPSMQHILTLLQENNLDAVDDILWSVDTEDSPEVIIMLLRVTYPVRKKLKNWNELLQLARPRLHQDN